MSKVSIILSRTSADDKRVLAGFWTPRKWQALGYPRDTPHRTRTCTFGSTCTLLDIVRDQTEWILHLRVEIDIGSSLLFFILHS